MSGIQYRTIFQTKDKNVVKFLDFARVTTELGTMLEPFNVWAKKTIDSGVLDFDPTEMMVKIDEVEGYNPDKPFGLASGGEICIGGFTFPHVGR